MEYFKICSKHIFQIYTLLVYQILLHTKIIYNISKLYIHMLCKVPSIFKLIHDTLDDNYSTLSKSRESNQKYQKSFKEFVEKNI